MRQNPRRRPLEHGYRQPNPGVAVDEVDVSIHEDFNQPGGKGEVAGTWRVVYVAGETIDLPGGNWIRVTPLFIVPGMFIYRRMDFNSVSKGLLELAEEVEADVVTIRAFNGGETWYHPCDIVGDVDPPLSR